ncbi:hypothetical protein [Pseudanabaena sp. FACHB-2040]|uniref:hypothetical protein n=1 Tax=Pseudanabaena sp. FACHB-2040 TaxID=2692859 RepID=UPI001689661D|nr:hypothetical protein [Pseudanabaena sp. FACHB-2040]MBD2259973.1 hypothetical protein [Pseudanabaena sp. FACHB-2040]
MASQITLNLIEGSVRFNFSPEAAQALKAEINTLMANLKAVAARSGGGSARSPESAMEYQHTGEVFLEIFCNPNIWPSPFAAKVLVTLRDDRIRLTTEAELTRVIEDLNTYLEQFA